MKKNISKNKIRWFIFLVSFLIFISLLTIVLIQDIFFLDTIVYQFIAKYLISDNLTFLFKIITTLGSSTVLISLTLLSFLFIKNNKINISLISNLIFVTILNYILKTIVARPRPANIFLIEEFGYSFPSGHAMISAIYYGFFIILIYRYIKNKPLKWFLISILLSIIFLIGFSRIYLGVHYLSDVVAGFSLAILYLIIYYEYFYNYIKK